MAKLGHPDPNQWKTRVGSLTRSLVAHLTLHHKHVKSSPEVDITVLGNSLGARAIPRQHEHHGSMLSGTVTRPAGSRARQVVGVKSDVIAEAVGSDAESQGGPAVHGRCSEGQLRRDPQRATRASGNRARWRLRG